MAEFFTDEQIKAYIGEPKPLPVELADLTPPLRNTRAGHMELQAIEQDFRQSVGEKVTLLREGNERYRVFTPFLFEDGDHLSIVFKKTGRDWVLSDEGNTLMRLTCEIDLRDLLRGNRQKIIDGALNTFGVANQDGELVFVVRDAAYGDAHRSTP